MKMDIKEIFEHLPQRYPFLLVDRVEELDIEGEVKPSVLIKMLLLMSRFLRDIFLTILLCQAYWY